MILFLLVVVLDLAGLFLAPGLVVGGIQNLREGSTVNADLDVGSAGWTFRDDGFLNATGSYRSFGGNPDGYLEMTLPGGPSAGSWTQAFDVSGSTPFAAAIRLDVDVTLGSGVSGGELVVYVSRTPGPPIGSDVVARVNYTSRTAWTSMGPYVEDAAIAGPGTYYVTISFAVGSGTGTTVVGFDNVRLRWTTDAGLIFYIPLPSPMIVYTSQNPAAFLAYYVLLIAIVTAASLYHGIRERKDIVKAFRAPIEAVGTRLRTKSAWLTIGQVWMALTFFQISVVLLLGALGTEPTSPIQVNESNAWLYLYELLNASVYEEFAFRLLLIGAPLAVGSLLLRIIEVNRAGGAWRGKGGASRHLAGSFRYLVGGAVSRSSGREALLASWAALVVSSTIFGLAHAPGWGWWKVLPSLVAGLAFGYLFLRHGVAAAILAHFVNDYLGSLIWMQVGGLALDLFVGLLFLGIAAAGTGFFVWYLLVAAQHLRDLAGRYAGRPPLPPGAPILPRVAPAAPASSPAYRPSEPAPSAPGTPRGLGPIPPEYEPTYRPPPYGYPPVRFQCPACGWIEARYESGQFTCARCGRAG